MNRKTPWIIKDYKSNFYTNATIGHICPKSDLGKTSALILDIYKLKHKNIIKLNLWSNSHEVINCFRQIL